MKFLFFLGLLVSVGFSVAFIPGRLRGIADLWSSLTHRIITKAGLLATVVEFLKDNPQYANKERIEKRKKSLESIQSRLFKGNIPHWLCGLIKSSKFKHAVKTIEYANVAVDTLEKTLTVAHFDAEQFVRSSKRLIDLKKQVICLINKAGNNERNYVSAREQTGRYLHTLQDFYSHSNWIEIGNRIPLKELGDSCIDETDVAGPDNKTCRDCTPAKLKFSFQTDDCERNLIPINKLTSGYFGGQDVDKPPNVGKCSHGGVFDSSRKKTSKGGINKDSTQRYLSPHHKLHEEAACVAIRATKLFFDSLRREVGDDKFAEFLNMKVVRTLSFAIDTTGSMAAEIADVKRATVQFIDDSAAINGGADDFFYVLVLFNDPGFGPAYVTRDPDEAKERVNSLRVHGGGDCPEFGMSGLYLALTHSKPNSDVFYFSDASAKDGYLAFSVLSVALKKQCRIYFFVSGTCGSRRKRRALTGEALYENLASTTGGQLLKFKKYNIDDAIKLVRRPNISEANSSVTLEELSLLTLTVKNVLSTTEDKSYSVESDSSVFSMTVVLSARDDANIKIVPPQDHNQTGLITIITQTSTVYSVRITKPTVGKWMFNITATGSYSLQVTAQSSLDFSSSLESEEYSATFQTVLIPLSGNPIKGRRLFVAVLPSQLDRLQADKNLTAHVLDTAGNKLDSFDLEHGQLFYKNSYYGSWIMKFDTFRLMFVGSGENGEIIQRVLPRLIKPQEFEIKLSTGSRYSLVISPNETSFLNVTLHNYGPRERFNILVLDERSFVASYGPKLVILNTNDSVDIQINLLAPYNTNDSTSTSVSVSASVPSSSGSPSDVANFISLGVSVFSKEFLFINETELQAVNLTSFLGIPNITKTADDPGIPDEQLTLYVKIVIGIGIVVVLGVIAVLVTYVLCKKSGLFNEIVQLQI